MFKAYKLYWKNYFNFGGKSSIGEYWLSVLMNLIISAIIGFVVGLIVGLQGEAAENNTLLGTVTSIWSLIIFIPSWAVFFRRLRDGGHSWANVFWLFLPLVGWIIVVIKLLSPSKSN